MIGKSVNIWLMGGLGNVLFQINFGRNLRESGYDVCFIDNLVKKNILTKVLRWKIHNQDYLYLDEDFQSKNLIYAFLAVSIAKFRIGSFSLWLDGIYDVNKDYAKNLFSYFQNSEGLKSIDIKINKADFKSGKNRNVVDENIVIHRRYTDSGWQQPSLASIEQKLQNSAVLVCSDSIAGVKHDFIQYNFDYKCREGFLSIDDFLVMANSQTLVCSNSTFALWAALIGDHDNVYMPRALVKTFPFIKFLKKNIYEF